MFNDYIDEISESLSSINKVGSLLGLESPVTIYALLNDSMDPRYHGKYIPRINWKQHSNIRPIIYNQILNQNPIIETTADALATYLADTRHYLDRVMAELSDDLDLATSSEAIAKIIKQIESYSLSAQHKLLLVVDSYYYSSRQLGIKENDLTLYKNIYKNVLHNTIELEDQLAHEIATFGSSYVKVPEDPYKMDIFEDPFKKPPEPKLNKLY